MKKLKPLYFLFLLTFILTACGHSKGKTIFYGKSYAEQELKSALTDSLQYNVIDNKRIIVKDDITAISIAEPILFSMYGKENIIDERPYEVYFIDNYWVISGTLEKGYAGGTFLIILDSRNCEIIRLLHSQ